MCRVGTVLGTGRDLPRLEQQVPAGEETEERACRQHRRAGVLVAREPVDSPDNDEERRDAEVEERFDLHWRWSSCSFWSQSGRSERIGGGDYKVVFGGG